MLKCGQVGKRIYGTAFGRFEFGGPSWEIIYGEKFAIEIAYFCQYVATYCSENEWTTFGRL
jgi:hypothetical protein